MSDLNGIVGHPVGIWRVGELVGVEKKISTHLVSEVLIVKKTVHKGRKKSRTYPEKTKRGQVAASQEGRTNKVA